MAEMHYGNIPGIEKPVSRLGQGTVMVNSKEPDKSFALLDAASESGVTLYDTAYVYGGGDNETTVGKWVNSRGLRNRVVVIGKGGHPRRGKSRVNPAAITEELNESLERFKFDYIDLYLLHRDDPDVPVGELVEMLNEHLKAGKIHAFGGSNWTYQRIKEANEYAEKAGLVPFSVSSPHFSLGVQFKPVWPGCLGISGPDRKEAREWYAKTNMPLITWSSLARGFFAGWFTKKTYKEKKDLLEECTRQAFAHKKNFKRLDRAFELAGEKGVTVSQIAVAYVMNYPLNIFALIGACTPDELRSNLNALNMKLTPEELAWLNMERKKR